jgi:hypothetical protein
MFSDKEQVNSLWQEIALNFFPARADFTTERTQGEEFADHLFSSYPELAHRELSNMLDEFLFPDNFMSIHVDDEDLDKGDDERAFLERLTTIQMKAMTDPKANLITARGQTNRDIAAFGNGAIQYSLNMLGNGLLFRNHHLRDCAWSENAETEVDHIHRKWKPTARQLVHHFGDKVSTDVKRAMEKDPEKTFECRHVVMPTRLYDYKSKSGKQYPFVSLYIECGTEHLLEEVPQNLFGYVIPRWQRISGSAYAVAMTTAILLPDGRTMQVVMRTLREAGEVYVNPPMIAVTEAIRGDIALYPGGVTTADIEYDERLGEVLRPATQNSSGFPIGMDIAAALKQDISSGFFLDKIQLPQIDRAMTATEVRRRIQEHIRAAAPISKPLQREFNAPLCDGVFKLLMDNGAFPLGGMPESLANRDIQFKFRSPLDELAEQNEAEVYLDIRDRIILPVAQIEPAIMDDYDLVAATKDAARSAGWKQKWYRSQADKEQIQAQREQQMQMQQAMAGIADASQVAQEAGKGIDAIANAGSGQSRPNVARQA